MLSVGVITFPGSNCDRDLVHVLRHVLRLNTKTLWHAHADLQGVDVVFLPGGFSYGDYLRSGAIARFAPIMQAVQAHAQAGGSVIGICNGFQILCEAGLLPGVLLPNAGGQFICANANVSPAYPANPWVVALPQRAYSIPFAHGEGRYYAPPEVVHQLEETQRVVLRYTNPLGEATPEANPNGSVHNIAGICNPDGNVLGLMPHPERAAEAMLGNTDGLELLKAFLNLQTA